VKKVFMRDRIKDYIESALQDGPKPIARLVSELKEMGFSLRTIQRAAQELKVVFYKHPTDGNCWALDEAQRLQHEGMDDVSLAARVEQERERIKRREELRELQQLQRTEAKRQEYLAVLREVLTPFEPSPLIALPNPSRHAPEIEWSIDLSDWQLGQYSPSGSTAGLFEQTSQRVAQQLDSLWEAIQDIHRIEVVSGHKRLSKIWMLFNGDLVEGDCLRPAQLRQIDKLVVQQVIEAADLAALLIRRCLTLPGVELIICDFVGGNHDRTTPRAGLAGLGEADYVDTYAWLIGSWIERMFENEPRVQVKVWDSFFGYREFGGLYHAFEHGASFRTSSSSYGGIPWYPIMNAAQQYTRMLVPELLPRVDIVHMGHFHQPAILPLGKGGWVIMNGALPPSSQFIQSSFKAVRQPLQWLIEYYPSRGWVNTWYPLYV
jgi:hypothetical protein